ncbi:MAG TPA: SDR family oxidoreductase [Sphingomonas sp.]|nr:SDR family oxidoreductase [Sphingomonas sp.]
MAPDPIAAPAGQVIVTGAASGIGAAIVRGLVACGRPVGALDIAPDGLARLRDEAGDLIRTACVDLTDPDALEGAIAACRIDTVPLTGLVNNAGGGGGQSLVEMTPGQWNATLALNLTSAFLATKAVLGPLMANGGGAIVNIGSIAAYRVSPVGGAAYAAAKAGMLAFTRQCAHELAAHRIRVNAICPGPTRTGLTRHSQREDCEFPLGRWIEPSDIVPTALHLLGPRSAMCTGAAITIDGGAGL